MPSAIEQKYQQLGGPSSFLGLPTSPEGACPDGQGRFRHYRHGSIYWHPDTSACEVHGLIRAKWKALGWERSFLGYPISDERETPGGRYSLFQHGVILWKTGATEAFEVHGAIRGKYIKLNSEKGFLGYPVTDERKTPDGQGRYNHFEHGSIYWHPDTGAYEVHGQIRSKWADLGWERSTLGYPITDEKDTPDGTERFNRFQHGWIYWNPTDGAYPVRFRVRIHAAVTGNDGTTGTTSPTFTSSFTWKKLVNLAAELDIIFRKSGIRILFDPRTDITEIESALLNEDVPFSNGKIVVPVKSVDDLSGNPNVVAQRQFADNLKGSLVIYFRDFDKDRYSYIDASGDKKRDTPVHFSGSKHLYVRYSKSVESDRLAHEMGHYFHLWHTFDPAPASVAEAAQMIKEAVESGRFSESDGDHVFDGDRGSGVLDTPPDPRGSVMAEVNAGNKCGPVGTAEVKVKFSNGSKRTYPLTPDRQNLMSYFQDCADTYTAHFSAGQIARARNTMEAGNRKHLVSQIPGTYTVVMRPGTQDERFIFSWKYKYFRMKYDKLWKQGWRLHVLENYVYRGDVLYTAVFRRSTVPEIQLYGWSYDAYRGRYDELWDQGWRLHILNNYVVNGEVKYTAVFRKSTAGEIQLYGWSYEAYRGRYDQLWDQGWRLHILNNYVVNGQVIYTAVFRESTAAEIQLYGWLYPSYRKRYDELWEQGWRLHILNNYRLQGRVRYTAVFRKSDSGEIQLYGWKCREFRERLEELWDDGLKVELLNVF